MKSRELRRGAIVGCMLGAAVGDALGLPAEGIRPSRLKRLWPGPWKHRLLFGSGMLSDDSEHAFFVAQSLLEHPDDPEAFSRSLAWRLRCWLLSIPAGLGLATLRACFKLLVGFPPSRSGVPSAGNGPAMRSAIIGAYFADDLDSLARFVTVSTRITHTDPRALVGALAIARVSAWSARRPASSEPDPDEIFPMLASLAPEDAEWNGILEHMKDAHSAGRTVQELANALGLARGVTGYVYHTVPVAIYAWLRHFGDFRATLESVLDCGGDTDTVGAIAGALAGTAVGESGIPREWLDGIHDWPRSLGILRESAHRLELHAFDGQPGNPVRYPYLGILPRNLFFLSIVLAHGFRRLLPPY